MTKRRLVVTGRVQGVGYRDWVTKEARRMGLTGWVRNRRNGSVEIVADGDAEMLDGLLQRCLVGPPTAQVATVEVSDTKEATEGLGFGIRPDA